MDIVPIVLGGALVDPLGVSQRKDQHLPIPLRVIDVDDDLCCKLDMVGVDLFPRRNSSNKTRIHVIQAG
jgi:hypothetical protein